MVLRENRSAVDLTSMSTGSAEKRHLQPDRVDFQTSLITCPFDRTCTLYPSKIFFVSPLA
jgi:hypothetical protein